MLSGPYHPQKLSHNTGKACNPCGTHALQAEEYQYYYGYTGSTPPSTAAAAAAQPGTSTVPPTAAASAQQVQQLSQDIRLAGDWTDLLQIAQHQQSLTPTLWLRLLFRWVSRHTFSAAASWCQLVTKAFKHA